MFKQRLLSTLVLVPLVLVSIYYAPGWLLAGILLFLIAACGFEWTKLIPMDCLARKMVYVVGLLAMVWLNTHGLSIWLTADMLLWIFVLIAVITFPQSQRFWGSSTVVGLAGLVFLPLFFSSFIGIYQTNRGDDFIVYILCLVWAADIGAYLVGKKWGRMKLIPNVSPGKTVEGSLGGVCLVMLVSVVGYYVFKPMVSAQWFLLALMTALISILGDLVVSMLKRRCHLKDSGQIIPGHGGILDRLDSSIAALPFFYYGLLFLEFGH